MINLTWYYYKKIRSKNTDHNYKAYSLKKSNDYFGHLDEDKSSYHFLDLKDNKNLESD